MREGLAKLPDQILTAARNIEALNYQHEVKGLRKQVHGISYFTYSLAPSPSEVLLTEFLSRSSPGDVLYDVGANIGNYTLVAAIADREVVSFEPDPEMFCRLQKNIGINDTNLVTAYNIGLANKETTLTFYQSSHQGRGSFNKFNATYDNSHIVGTQDVDVTMLDRIIESDSLPSPNHLKVDVEGFEKEVLQGASQTIEKYRPTLYIEPHETAENHGIEGLQKLVKSFNYKIEDYGYPWVCEPINDQQV
ncbi:MULTISPECIES: FkbM family methyltransferase [Halorussus]|uniref:FkbM family methyltransferase n=1 Tax=Halorussus TaxID=1070314 RepID=UPI0013B38825|nr:MULTISPECIES: FkbM family methyltransferase [Halorussus]NHN58563.1 FkbM family methyltransferase [Halorussus sp. JP-T4]